MLDGASIQFSPLPKDSKLVDKMSCRPSQRVDLKLPKWEEIAAGRKVATRRTRDSSKKKRWLRERLSRLHRQVKS